MNVDLPNVSADVLRMAADNANRVLGYDEATTDVSDARESLSACDTNDASQWAMLVIGFVVVTIRGASK